MGEFGRSPWINQARGRDHFPDAWSLAMAGGGVQGGALVGATDKYGAEVIEDPFNEENLFATIFSALDIDPHAEFKIDGFPTFHHVENKAAPISQILSLTLHR